MSLRPGEFDQLAAAGWIIVVDSPWRRAAERLRILARTMLRPAGRTA